MSLSVVYGREIDGVPTTFGTSGYTYDNTFVLYDRATESLWHPSDAKGLTAAAGPLMGRRLEFLQTPTRMKLGEWRARHPGTEVLLGDRSKIVPDQPVDRNSTAD